MASRSIEDWQVDFIVDHHREATAEQLAVKLKCPLWRIYEVCDKKGIRPLKPREHKEQLSLKMQSLYAYKKMRSNDTPVQKEETWQRPPAVYTNSPSPYGIADQLHHGKNF
jgi:hypothetical protein